MYDKAKSLLQRKSVYVDKNQGYGWIINNGIVIIKKETFD